MFFIIPGIFVSLTLIDSRGIAMYTFLGIVVFMAIIIGLLKFMQGKESLKQYLPQSLRTFEFLPKPLRSLEPYDKILTTLPCFKKCSDSNAEDFELGDMDKIPEKRHGAVNPTFEMA